VGGRVTGGRSPAGGGTVAPKTNGHSASRREIGRASIGMLGGTFDPIHLGHLALARAARSNVGLDEIVFVPAARPPHKLGRPISPANDRLAMVELAVEGEPATSVSRIELDRSGPSYTVDTVAAMLDQAARSERDIDITVILSAESFADLLDWHAADRLVELATIAVAPRPGHPLPDPTTLADKLPGLIGRLIVIHDTLPDISASAIRARVAAGRPIDHLVPPRVAAYIEEHHLYRDPSTRKDSQ
jgi:nicotinate-nucleotide adenylyltransferase